MGFQLVENTNVETHSKFIIYYHMLSFLLVLFQWRLHITHPSPIANLKYGHCAACKKLKSYKLLHRVLRAHILQPCMTDNIWFSQNLLQYHMFNSTVKVNIYHIRVLRVWFMQQKWNMEWNYSRAIVINDIAVHAKNFVTLWSVQQISLLYTACMEVFVTATPTT